jgi:hypothetical protein
VLVLLGDPPLPWCLPLWFDLWTRGDGEFEWLVIWAALPPEFPPVAAIPTAAPAISTTTAVELAAYAIRRRRRIC